MTPTAIAPTGVPGLDDILTGGLPKNRLYLTMGSPGVGKTTLGLQFLFEGRDRGETVLYVTLSETSEELRDVAQSHGWSLEGVHLLELSSLEEAMANEAQNTLFHPSEIELHETIQKMLTLMKEIKPSRVVLDSLSEIRLLAGDALRYRRQILSLKQFFVGRNCTVMLLDDGTAEANDLQLQSLVHGVITLQQLAPEYGAERRRIRVQKLRGVNFRSGNHDYIIEKNGMKVFPRLVAAEHRSKFARDSITSGVPELDQLLGGGIDRGTSTVIIGPAGTGKSSITTQFAKSVIARGEKVAAFTFDENVSTFLARAGGMGNPLEEAVKNGMLMLRQVDSAELSPGEFAHAIRDAVDAGAKVVIIDSLNGYLNAMPEERFLLIQLHELLTYLAQKGVATLLVVTQHGLVGTMQTPVDVTYVADTVILMRLYEADSALHRAISVTKKRTGPHEQTIRELQLTQDGVRLGPALRNLHGILTGVPKSSQPSASHPQ
ncbi:MAG: gas vesicle protein GvpD [Archangium sp.]|nr:gas vesicle protein GvpD [Archangium sp.]MDP3157036.1 gas vesicle protein GvpD [Archangium sp.]MDP3575753.1 gas vesicle protein GvpD [Archangium sp.]